MGRWFAVLPCRMRLSSIRAKITLALLAVMIAAFAVQIGSQYADQYGKLIGGGKAADRLLTQIIARQIDDAVAKRETRIIDATMADIVHVTKNPIDEEGSFGAGSDGRSALVAMAVFDATGKRIKRFLSIEHATFSLDPLGEVGAEVLRTSAPAERDLSGTYIVGLPMASDAGGTTSTTALVVAWDLSGKQSEMWLALARSAGLALLAAVAILFVCALAIDRIVAVPVTRMTGVMSRLAGGDQGAAIPALERKDEIGEMARSLTVIRETGVRSARVRTALDNAASVTLMASLDGKIIYANQAARRYFAEFTADVRSVLPGFRAESLDGMDIAGFFADAAAMRQELTTLQGTREERLSLGGRTVAVTLNPVTGEGGNRLGTVLEWVDVTEQLKAEAEKAARLAKERVEQEERRKMELAFQTDLTAFVEAAAAGDLSMRVELAGRNGLMLQLGEGMNRWADAVAAAMGEVVDMMAALAEGDLSKRIAGDYRGDLLRLKADSNATAEKLAGIVGQTVDGMATIKSATEQLTAGSKDLSSRTEEQVANLEEMAASIRQISVTIRQNAQNAHLAKDVALAASGTAESGGAVTSQAVTAVGQIEESAQKIAEIVGTMDEIAFQTNLLALNAAVEAARAGDAGRGFAVVAEEVRALAQRSSQASKEIRSLITTSGNQVKKGVELVNKAGSSLGEIVASVKRVAEIVSEIAAASQEQSEGIQQVSDSVTQMEDVTQKNAALVEESTASLNAVDRQVDGLSKVVSFFTAAQPSARDLQVGFFKRVLGSQSVASLAPGPDSAPPTARAAADRWKGF